MKKLILIFLLANLTVSCSQDKSSYQYFLMHPNATKAQFEKCAILPTMMSEINPECQNVVRAALELRSLSVKAAYSQLEFGLQLMATETKLVDLQKKIAKLAPRDNAYQKLHAEYQRLWQQQQVYFMVIRLVRNNM